MNNQHINILPNNDAVSEQTDSINRQHSQMVFALVKPGQQLMLELGEDPEKILVLRDCLLEIVNTSRWLDNVKKMAIYNQPLKDTKHFDEDKLTTLEEAMANLTPEKCDLLHAAVGIASEAGEILERVLEVVFCGEDITKDDNAVEELGDMEFYLKQYRGNKLINVTRDATLQHNLAKLAKRYKDYQYSDAQAAERNDKKEGVK